MQTNRFVKATVFVVAACVGALFLAQFGGSLGEIEASVPAAAAQEQGAILRASSPIGGGPSSPAAASTLQHRWRVRSVALSDSAAGEDCTTVVLVQNLAPTSTSVDIDWYDYTLVLKASQSQTIGAGQLFPFAVYVIGEATYISPYMAAWVTADANFFGFAQVHASDPRIAVSAYLRCDTAPADMDPVTLNSIPCDPVGASLSYFQAGMPATWKPPMAVPEAPE